ncbi:MAG: ABC transporter permease [Puniceicoccales bacterium]|jgi:oligopeptide transport system permease protein|nr:ABC transporter permease [Puniceicoccales bacterium]
MLSFLLKRALAMLPVLWIVATAVFFLARFAPGGPFDMERPLPEHVKARLNAHYGLDRPLAEQYVRYMANLARGDLGPSYKYPGWSVGELIAQRARVSAELGAWALLAAILAGIPAGALAARRHGSRLDRALTGAAALGVCVPAFVLGPLLALVFALKLGVFNALGWDTAGDRVLPALALGLTVAAPLARLTRASMLEVAGQDYMRTARAKGLSEARVWFVHGLRNALTPVVTFLGPAAAGLLSGSFVIESVFNIPGLGRLFVSSAFDREYTMICGTVLFYAAALMALNLAVEVAVVWLNPRLRRSVAGGGGTGGAEGGGA